MNRLIKILLLPICTVMLYTSANAQQDAQFSQYIFHGLYINPAYAGYREALNVNAAYRTQWVDFPGAPKTLTAAVDAPLRDGKAALGFHIANDRIGADSESAAYATYAFRIKFGNRKGADRTLAMGLSAGVIYYQIDKSKLDPNDPDDPFIDALDPSRWLPDARFGLYYYTNSFFTGFSVDNLFGKTHFKKSDEASLETNKNPHLYLTAGGLIPLSESLMLKPSFLIKEDLAGPTSIDLNAFVLFYKTLWIGGTYRTAAALFNKDAVGADLEKHAAIIGMIEVVLNNNMRLGYSYDYTLSSSVLQRYPTHELSLGYTFSQTKARMRSPRYF